MNAKLLWRYSALQVLINRTVIATSHCRCKGIRLQSTVCHWRRKSLPGCDGFLLLSIFFSAAGRSRKSQTWEELITFVPWTGYAFPPTPVKLEAIASEQNSLQQLLEGAGCRCWLKTEMTFMTEWLRWSRLGWGDTSPWSLDFIPKHTNLMKSFTTLSRPFLWTKLQDFGTQNCCYQVWSKLIPTSMD